MSTRTKASKRLLAILTVSLAASLIIPFALANSENAPTPLIPSQCTATVASGWSSTPIINARMTMHNDEDSGVVGYWALDSYVKSFVVWENSPTPATTTTSAATSSAATTASTTTTTTSTTAATPPRTFCALVQYSGTWTTFQGALSPQNGVKQQNSGSGDMKGAMVIVFTGNYLGPFAKHCEAATCSIEPTSGNIGTFNLGGTSSQIELGTYAKQTPFNPVNFLSYYFKAGYTITGEPAWSRIYSHGNSLGYGNMWVNDVAGSFGDIVT
jgi:hypothetical protein